MDKPLDSKSSASTNSATLAKIVYIAQTLFPRKFALPLLPHALGYARMGLIPAGSHLNRTHCAPAVDVAPSVDEAVESIVFDAQTSGGIVLAVPGEALGTVRDWLEARGEMAVEIGEVLEARSGGPRLLLR